MSPEIAIGHSSIGFFVLIIWDAILENQSEIKHVTFSVFYLLEVLIGRSTLILLKILPESDQWFQSYEQLKDYSQTIENKNFWSFFGLYLTINVSDL